MLKRSSLPKRSSVPAAALAAFSILAAGCSSLPAPGSARDTALAIPVTFEITDEHYDEDDRGARYPAGYYQLAIRRVDDGAFYRAVSLYAGSGVKVVTGLPSGEYYLDRYRFRYKRQMSFEEDLEENPRGRGGPSRDLGARFSLEPGAVTLSPLQFHMTMDRIGEKRYENRVLLEAREMNDAVREKTLRALRERGHFDRRRVSG